MDGYQNPGGQQEGGEPQLPPWQRTEQQEEQTSQEPAPQFHQNKKRPIGTYVIAAAILLVAIFIANSVWNRDDDSEKQTEDNAVVMNEETGSSSVVAGLVEAVGLSDFDDLDEASLIVNSAQGKPTTGEGAEQISYGVVESNRDDMVYFATEELRSNDLSVFVGIYHYNTVSNRWQRIFKTVYDNHEVTGPFNLHLLGRTENHLIVQKNAYVSSPGPCASPWLLGDSDFHEIFLLSLDDPYGKFIPYELPNELREREERHTTECESNL